MTVTVLIELFSARENIFTGFGFSQENSREGIRLLRKSGKKRWEEDEEEEGSMTEIVAVIKIARPRPYRACVMS